MGLVYKFGFRHHTFSLLSSSQQKPRRAEIISYLHAWARMSSKHVPTEIPRVGLIDWSAENICNFKIVIIMYWGYHHTVKVDTNNAWEHVWTFAGGLFILLYVRGLRGPKEWLRLGFDYIKGLFSTQAPCDRLSQWWGCRSPGLLISWNWHRNSRLGFS